MEILQTRGQMESGRLPSKLEVMRELDKRGVSTDEYSYLKKGYQGEQWVLEKLTKFGANHWKVLQNVWLEKQGVFECDLLVLTTAGIYTFEIKNYSGHFEFKNSICYLNGKKIGHNAIYQAQKSAVNLESRVHEGLPGTNVQGALLFVGEYNTVDVQDPPDHIQIIMRNQIRNFIWKMVNDERNLQGPGLEIDVCIQWLEKFETKNPFGPKPVTSETATKLRKGICCSHCGSFDVDARKSYLTCLCGMHEPRENAIVRTICEYGVIYFDQDLRTTELLDFFNGEISRTNLTHYLNKYFVKMGNNRSSRFINKRRPIDIIINDFRLTKPRYLEIY